MNTGVELADVLATHLSAVARAADADAVRGTAMAELEAARLAAGVAELASADVSSRADAERECAAADAA